MKSIFSVDVEDWFHILDLESTPKLSEWDSMASCVEKDFRKLLDIFDKKSVKVTCFFLGWIAERFPHLVKEASGRGHEIASHGYSHELVYKMSTQEFFQDAVKVKAIIEDISGRPVLGYRSSGFSVTEATPWFFDKLIEAGYIYDSSVFPARRGHGGMVSDHLGPYTIKGSSGSITEFPITVIKILGSSVCFCGGGYLRLFPYFAIRNMAIKVLKDKRPVVFYVHPREINPDHPRLPMNYKRRFKSYVNLKTTENKIMKILNEFEIITFEGFMSSNPGAG